MHKFPPLTPVLVSCAAHICTALSKHNSTVAIAGVHVSMSATTAAQQQQQHEKQWQYVILAARVQLIQR